MAVRAICNPNVATVPRGTDITAAAKLMRQEHVGDLIVTEIVDDVNKPVGILTDRDIVVEVVAKSINPVEVTVGDAMSGDILTINEDNSVGRALRFMSEAGVRRAPVVSQSGDLVGVLALDDVVDHIAAQLSDVAGAIRNEQRIEQRLRP